MAFPGAGDGVVLLFEYGARLRALARRLNPEQAYGLGVKRLFSGVLEGCCHACAKGGLDPAQPPFRVLRVGAPIAGGKMADANVLLHVLRIERKADSIDARRKRPRAYSNG